MEKERARLEAERERARVEEEALERAMEQAKEARATQEMQRLVGMWQPHCPPLCSSVNYTKSCNSLLNLLS